MSAPGPGSAAQTTVAVVTPPAQAFVDELRISGTLEAVHRAGLSVRVDGLVDRVLVDAGDHVQAGDLLLQLDPLLAEQQMQRSRAETQQARVHRDEAQRRVEEALHLTRDRHLPATELARRQAELAMAEAALATRQAMERETAEYLRRHRLPAPFAGVVVRRHAEAGEWVMRGTAVLELVALLPLRLDVHVPQERFAEIDRGTRVEVRPDIAPEQVLPARIDAVVPVGDAGSRAFLVRVVVEEGQDRLFPGTSASAVFQLSSQSATHAPQLPIVPRDALLHHPDGGYSLFVIVDENGQSIARRRLVQPGPTSVAGVQILRGLTAGEAVVVRGNEALRDGQAVRVMAGPD